MDQTLDMRGQACPIPVINAKKAIEGATEAGTLTVLVDNETSVKNLTKLAQSKGLAVTDSKKAENEYAVVMALSGEKAQENAAEPDVEASLVPADRRRPLTLSVRRAVSRKVIASPVGVPVRKGARLEARQHVADRLPVHHVRAFHDRHTRHEVHRRRDKIELLAVRTEARIRHVGPHHGIAHTSQRDAGPQDGRVRCRRLP